MSLNHHLSTRYGTGLQQTSSRLKRISLQSASAKNRILFLERCCHHKIIPRFLQIKCPIKTQHAKRLTENYSSKLLHAALSQARGQLNSRKKEETKLIEKIKKKVNPEDFEKISSAVRKSYDAAFKRHSQKLRQKFDLLQKKKTVPPPLISPNYHKKYGAPTSKRPTYPRGS